MDPSAGCLVSLGASYAAEQSRVMAVSMARMADNNANHLIDGVLDEISLSTVAASLGFSARGAYGGKGLLMAGGDAASALQAITRAEAEAAVTSFKQCKTMDCVGVAHQRMIEARDSYRAAGNLPYDSDGNALNSNIMQAAGLLGQVSGAMQAGATVAIGTLGGVASKGAGQTTRIRHYTSNSGLGGIQGSGVIKASDQKKVFAESARGAPFSARDAEKAYGLRQGRGRNYVETDIPTSQVNSVYNPLTRSHELQLRGDVPLVNPTFHKR
jgi:hypothetical protein